MFIFVRMYKFDSKDSKKPKFGIKYLKQVVNLMIFKKWSKIADNIMIYIDYSLKLDLKLWNMFDVKIRTNNQADA